MIIAVDFDGILCKNEFPAIGTPNYQIISIMRQLIDAGHEVILWTTRNGTELDAAIEWCNDYGLHFSNVNGPAPSNEREYRNKYPVQSRKIYADVYIDDHNIEFIMPTPGVHPIKVIEQRLNKGLEVWKWEKEN